MSNQTETKSTGKRILSVFEVGITSISFVVIFVTFMISIISRYVLRVPVTWTYEISILGYMWTMFFGVGRAIDNDEHVVFSLVYDRMSPSKKRGCLILYNLLLTVLLLIAFIPCLQAMLKSTMTTGVLKIPYKLVFSPFFFMMAEIIVKSGRNVYKALKTDIPSTTGKEGKPI